jgi:ATP-binding cassette subfamily B protein
MIPQNILSFLLFFMRKHRSGFILIALSATIVHVSSNTLWPYIMGELVNTFNELDTNDVKSVESLFWPMIWAFIFWASAVLAHSVKGFMLSKVNPLFCADIRRGLFDRVMQHKHSYFVHKHIGSIAQRISDLPRSAQYICDNALTVFGPIAISIVLSSAVFFQVHYIPSLIFVFLL